MRTLVLVLCLVLCVVAPAMAQEPTSMADSWGVGTFFYDPEGQWEGDSPRISIMALTVMDEDPGLAEFKASADPSYGSGRDNYLVGTFAGKQVCANCLGGTVIKTTKVTVTNRSISNGEWDLLNGRLVYAVAKTKTLGEGEGQETTILELTITVLR